MVAFTGGKVLSSISGVGNSFHSCGLCRISCQIWDPAVREANQIRGTSSAQVRYQAREPWHCGETGVYKVPGGSNITDRMPSGVRYGPTVGIGE